MITRMRDVYYHFFQHRDNPIIMDFITTKLSIEKKEELESSMNMEKFWKTLPERDKQKFRDVTKEIVHEISPVISSEEMPEKIRRYLGTSNTSDMSVMYEILWKEASTQFTQGECSLATRLIFRPYIMYITYDDLTIF